MFQNIGFGACSTYYEMFQKLVNNLKIKEENLEIYFKLVSLRHKIIYEYDKMSKEEIYSETYNFINNFHLYMEDISNNI